MMIRIGDVWDSTVDAARGRAGLIAPIAFFAFFLPGVIQNGVTAFLQPGPTLGLIVGLIVGVTVLLTLWGQLAIIAIVTDPATTRADATRAANARFGAAIANAAALLAIVLVVLIPFAAALGLSGIDFAAMQGPRSDATAAMAGASRGTLLFAFLYFLFFIGFSFWLSARVMLTYAVVLNERLGIGAIRRSIALTRGATWKLIAVLILYAIVLTVTMFAAQAIVAIPVRLALGTEGAATAAFIGAIAGGIVSAVLVALFCIFTGRLYVAAAVVPAGKDHAPTS